jgi:hypothetical protein
MTSLLRFLDVQCGLHSTVNDFTTMPTLTRRLQLVGGGETLMPRKLQDISRNDIAALDGRGFTQLYGPLDLADVAPVLEWKGVNSNTGAAVAGAAWHDKVEQGELMTSMMGALPVTTTGAAPTVAASGHSTTTLVFVGTAPVVGEMVLFQTSLGPRIRTVVSFVTLTATFDRPYTGTPTASSTIIRACRWDWAPGVANHTHVGFRAELPDVQADFVGCAPVSMALAVPTSGRLTSTFTFSPTDVDGFKATSAPTTTFPAAGNPLVGINAELFIGSESFVVDSLSLNVATGNEPRTSPSSENGRLGGIAADKRGGFTLTASIRNEPQARGGIERNTGTETLRTIMGDVLGAGAVSAERDVLLVIGRAAGAAMAVRLPNAALSAATAAVGSVAGVNLTFTATRNASLGLF